MGDLNHTVDSEQVIRFLQQHQLHNIHQSLHPSYNSHLPTHDRGSQSIDAIFASQGISANKGGFLGFKTFPSDHRFLWCDISINSLFGSTSPTIIAHSRRRLQYEDPRTVTRFNKSYHQLLLQHNMFSSLASLNSSITGPLSPQQQELYETLNQL